MIDESFDPSNPKHVQKMIEEQQEKQQSTWQDPEQRKTFGLQNAASTAKEQGAIDEANTPVAKKVEPVNPFVARMSKIRETQQK
ncbi:hypothetical protein HYS03_00250 [Candidatus Woesebacteria bacterium]|nr:hypothetical protein [Candidatus Woesebacteria bacterium]QQG47389.1 MAG: hypothetical protein HY044_04670 [Candidatus Woesebacteria bacterium]